MNKRNFIASISLAVASVFVVAPAAAQDVKARMGHVFELFPMSCTGLLAN
jgi:hypothetical protein